MPVTSGRYAEPDQVEEVKESVGSILGAAAKKLGVSVKNAGSGVSPPPVTPELKKEYQDGAPILPPDLLGGMSGAHPLTPAENVGEQKGQAPTTPYQSPTGQPLAGVTVTDPYRSMTIDSALGQAKLLKEQAATIRETGKEISSAYKAQEKEVKKIQGVALENYTRKSKEVEQHAKDKIDFETKLTKIHEDIQNTKIDPNRFFNNRSNSQKAMLAIGTFLAGMGDGPNQVLNLIDNMIARDIDAQKTDLNTKKEGSDSLIKLFKAKYPENPEKALQLYYQNWQSAILQGFASKVKGAEANLRLEELGQELERRKAVTFKDLAKSLRDHDLKLQTLQLKADTNALEAKGIKPLTGEDVLKFDKTKDAAKWLLKMQKLIDQGVYKYTPGIDTEFDTALRGYAQDSLFYKSGANVPPHEVETIQNRYQRLLGSDEEHFDQTLDDADSLRSTFQGLGGGDGYPRFTPNMRRTVKNLLKQLSTHKRRRK